MNFIFNNKINSEERKNLLIKAVVVISIIVISVHAYDAYNKYLSDIENEIVLNTLKYKKQEKVLRSKSIYEKENEKLSKENLKIKSEKFITAKSVTLAEAKFQNIIRKFCSKNKINIKTIRTLKKYKKSGFSYLQINISTKAEIGHIKNFLIDISNSKQYIFVKDVEIKTISRREKRFYYMNAKLIALTES